MLCALKPTRSKCAHAAQLAQQWHATLLPVHLHALTALRMRQGPLQPLRCFCKHAVLPHLELLALGAGAGAAGVRVHLVGNMCTAHCCKERSALPSVRA